MGEMALVLASLIREGFQEEALFCIALRQCWQTMGMLVSDKRKSKNETFLAETSKPCVRSGRKPTCIVHRSQSTNIYWESTVSWPDVFG